MIVKLEGDQALVLFYVAAQQFKEEQWMLSGDEWVVKDGDKIIHPILSSEWFWREGKRYTLTYQGGYRADAIRWLFSEVWSEELISNRDGFDDGCYELVCYGGNGWSYYRPVSVKEVILNWRDKEYHHLVGFDEMYETFSKPRKGDPKNKNEDDKMLTFIRNYTEHVALSKYLQQLKRHAQ